MQNTNNIPDKFLREDIQTFKRKFKAYCKPSQFKIISYDIQRKTKALNE